MEHFSNMKHYKNRDSEYLNVDYKSSDIFYSYDDDYKSSDMFFSTDKDIYEAGHNNEDENEDDPE